MSELKYGIGGFHPGYKYFRASSWAKLPPLWYLATEYGKHYDYIWFVDSDAAPNPLRANRSVGDAIQQWNTDPETYVFSGNTKTDDSTFIFFSNFPWREDYPCAGTFLFRPVEAIPILQEWWDYDIPQKNYRDFMEQDALWYMLEYKKFAIEGHYTLLTRNEPQFPSQWHGVPQLWIAHIPNYNPFRSNYFLTM